MKKFIPLVLIIILVFTGCQNSRTNEFSYRNDVYQFSNLKWGITQQEAKAFLKLNADEIISLPSDIEKEGFSFKTNLLGEETTISLLFLDESANLPNPIGLSLISITFSSSDAKAVYDILYKQIGEWNTSNYIIKDDYETVDLKSEGISQSEWSEKQISSAKEILQQNFPDTKIDYMTKPLSEFHFAYNKATQQIRIDVEAIPMAVLNNID